jgi:hypothetical protein
MSGIILGERTIRDFPAPSFDCKVCEYRNQVNALLTPPGNEKNG